jgi:hypothetical protein
MASSSNSLLTQVILQLKKLNLKSPKPAIDKPINKNSKIKFNYLPSETSPVPSGLKTLLKNTPSAKSSLPSSLLLKKLKTSTFSNKQLSRDFQ